MRNERNADVTPVPDRYRRCMSLQTRLNLFQRHLHISVPIWPSVVPVPLQCRSNETQWIAKSSSTRRKNAEESLEPACRLDYLSHRLQISWLFSIVRGAVAAMSPRCVESNRHPPSPIKRWKKTNEEIGTMENKEERGEMEKPNRRRYCTYLKSHVCSEAVNTRILHS